MTDQGQIDSPAVLLLDIPPSILCGIDLLSFTTSPNFHGIKNLPPGFHFIFTSESSSLSIRDGFWFHVPAYEPTATKTGTTAPPLIVRIWNAASSSLYPAEHPEDHRGKLAEYWTRGLSPYRQSADKDEAPGDDTNWRGLTSHITPATLNRLTQSDAGKDVWRITSASCARVDQDDIPGLSEAEHQSALNMEERELGVLGIDLKRTWPEGAVGRERTEAAMDRSWALGEVVRRWQGGEPDHPRGHSWGDVILGQMEASFIMVLTLANYSCLEEWKRCVNLVLTSVKAVRDHPQFYTQFFHLLRKQMERCEDVEGGLFDMTEQGSGLLKGWMKSFKHKVNQHYDEDEIRQVRRELDELEDVLKEMFGWQLDDEHVLRKGLLELEDGERVELELDQDAEDSDASDYRPVVVDLNEV